MGFLPATGFGAGAGGQMLQQIQDAQQRAAEIAQQQELARQHLLLDQQEMQQKSQLAQATLQSVNQQRQAEEQKLADARAGQATGMLTPQTVMSPTSGILKMVQGTPYESLFQPDQSLGSANISGPAGGPMNVTANPGQATGQVRYLGTPGQLQQQSQDAARGRFMAAHPELADVFGALDQKEIGPAMTDLIKGSLMQPKADTEGVFRQNTKTGAIERMQNGQWTPWTGGDVPKGAHFMTDANPPGPQYSVQGVTMPDGTGGLIRLDSRSGAVSPVVLPQGMTAGKPSAGATVKAEDRKRASNGLDQLDQAITNAKDLIGPGAGRISTMEQMIGNPDPKIQALGTKMLMAKMTIDAGIGGARAAASPQLLQRWDNLFSQKLTPESLHATVQAMREMLNAGQTSAPSGGSGTTLSAADLIKKYGG